MVDATTMIVEKTARRRTSKPFYTGMAIILAATVFLGFAPTFYLRGYVPLPLGVGPLYPLLVAHGLVNTLWFALFLAQTLLIAASRTDLHRRLGVLGAVRGHRCCRSGYDDYCRRGPRRAVRPLSLTRVCFSWALRCLVSSCSGHLLRLPSASGVGRKRINTSCCSPRSF